MVKTRVCLPADLAKTAGGEVAKILWQRDPYAQGQSGGAGRTGVALGLGEEPARDAVAAEIGVHGNAAEVKALALPGCEHAAHETPTGLGDNDSVVREGSGDGLGGLRERAQLRLQLAAVFLEGLADEVGDCRALGGRGEADGDRARRRAQMPVCSGRWSSATKLLNFVVSPSKRSMTLLMGP